jgi:hypothetical protein
MTFALIVILGMSVSLENDAAVIIGFVFIFRQSAALAYLHLPKRVVFRIIYLYSSSGAVSFHYSIG